MTLRKLARQRAFQLLYALEFNQQGFDDAEADFLAGGTKRRKTWDDFSRTLAYETHSHRETLDPAIGRALLNWKVERLVMADRITLRMALTELRHFSNIPIRVTINEYIELAKLFGTEDSPKFVNGVLDRLAKSFPHKDVGGSNRPEAIREAEGEDGLIVDDSEDLAGFEDEPAETASEPETKTEPEA